MLEKFLKILFLVLLPLKIFSQDTFTIHSSRDKTSLLAVEKLGDNYFVFFYDSTFFDKRIKCKVFNSNKPDNGHEFFLTPAISTFQDGLSYRVISDKLIFVSFIDYRNDAEGDIYSQLIDEKGILWDSAGIPICIQKGIQKNINVNSDNQNIFIVWEDFRFDRGGDIYLQKIDFFGNIKWKENGIVVSNVDGSEGEPQVVPDYSGGCFISWIEKILKVNKTYIQYINANNQKLFGQFGIYISNPEGSSIHQLLVIDEKNEPVIFYTDKKNISKIYFQRITKRGLKKTGPFGKELYSKGSNQELIDVLRFSKNEFVILFLVEENIGQWSTYLQIVNPSDKLKFKLPIKIHSPCKFHQKPKISIDQNGFFIYWSCYSQNSDAISLFIQTITLKGEILKNDGLKLNEVNLSHSSKFFLTLNNPVESIISNLDNRNGIYFKYFYLNEYKDPKIENFKIDHYEGLVKLSWELYNDRPGTRVIVERFFEDENQWIAIFNYDSKTTASFRKMNYDDKIYESENVKYRLRLIDPDGKEKTIEEEFFPDLVPEGFFLFQNSPNPFSTSTKISFRLPVKSKVVIKIYNARLEEIATVFDEIKEAGIHEFEFFPFPSMESGVYFYRISASGFYDVKKMIYSK